MVEGLKSIFCVDDHQNQIGTRNRSIDLVMNILIQLRFIGDTQTTGIDHFDNPVTDFHFDRHSVAGHARFIVNNTDPPFGEPIQQRRFTDIGATDDGNA